MKKNYFQFSEYEYQVTKLRNCFKYLHKRCEQFLSLKKIPLETRSCYLALAGLELMILLPQPPDCWGYRHAPPCLATFFINMILLKIMNALVFVVLCSRDFFPYENVQQISAQL
jgi:hypothetical protein